MKDSVKATLLQIVTVTWAG